MSKVRRRPFAGARRAPLHGSLAFLLALLAGCGNDAPQSSTPSAPPAAATAAAHVPGEMLKVGDVAPDFRVKDDKGKERTLGEFQGRRVVLWFFPKALTGG